MFHLEEPFFKFVNISEIAVGLSGVSVVWNGKWSTIPGCGGLFLTDMVRSSSLSSGECDVYVLPNRPSAMTCAPRAGTIHGSRGIYRCRHEIVRTLFRPVAKRAKVRPAMFRLTPYSTFAAAFAFLCVSASAHAQQPAPGAVPPAPASTVQAPADPSPPSNGTPVAPPPAPTSELPPPAPPPPNPPPPNPAWAAQPANPMPILPPPLPPKPAPPPAEKFPTRSLRIGQSLQTFLYKPFPYENLSRVGTGVFSVYEFFLKRSAVIGINLSYRYFPGDATLHQVGYGLILKHYLAGMNSLDSTFMPFAEYGLLLQINKLSTRKGTGTAHDTRLSVGTDIRIAKKIFFVEGSWHYSRLSLFEQPAEHLDNLEFDVGYRFAW